MEQMSFLQRKRKFEYSGGDDDNELACVKLYERDGHTLPR